MSSEAPEAYSRMEHLTTKALPDMHRRCQDIVTSDITRRGHQHCGTLVLFSLKRYDPAFHRKHNTLQWRHNGRDSVSNHQPHDCLLNRLFRRISKETSKLRVTCLCAGNSPGIGEFPAQRASYAENVSIWWRHHDAGFISDLIGHTFKTSLVLPSIAHLMSCDWHCL